MKNALIILALLVGILFLMNPVYADPMVQVSSSVSPTPVAPGTDGYVQLTFSNTGSSSASNIQITGISAEPNIQVSWSGVSSLGALGNGQSKISLIKFSVSNSAPSGLYTITFATSICTTSCTETDQTAVVTVQAPSSLEVASVSPSTLAAGQTATLNFNLVNEGADDISNVILTWQTPNNEILPLGLSNRQFISSIGAGTTLTIPINITVDSTVAPGTYPLTVVLSYADKSGVTRNVSSSIGIKIGGSTDFDVAVQQYASGTLSLSIANIGVNPATSVSVIIPQQSSFTATGATSVFLGNLNSGDFSIANFQITSKIARNFTSQRPTNGGNGVPNIPNGTSNALTVQIDYSDTSGVRQSVQKQVTLDISSSLTTATTSTSRGFSLMNYILLIAIAVIVIAVVLVWYFKFRKKKKSLTQFISKKLHKD
jgi:hypothetical protein